MASRYSSNLELAAYSGPMIAMSIVNMLLIAYLPNFYAAEIGITIATVGAIFMGARAFDAVIDPVIGNLDIIKSARTIVPSHP